MSIKEALLKGTKNSLIRHSAWDAAKVVDWEGNQYRLESDQTKPSMTYLGRAALTPLEFASNGWEVVT